MLYQHDAVEPPSGLPRLPLTGAGLAPGPAWITDDAESGALLDEAAVFAAAPAEARESDLLPC